MGSDLVGLGDEVKLISSNVDDDIPDGQHNIFRCTCGHWLLLCNNNPSLHHLRHIVRHSDSWVFEKCELRYFKRIKKINVFDI